jgi:hypothetical protein
VRSENATAGSSSLWDNVVVRLAAYYAVMLGLFVGLGVLFPSITEYMDLERIRVVTSTQDLFGTGAGDAGRAYSTAALFTPERVIPVLMSMFGALALALPIGWVYSWTGSNHKSRQGVARALVVMPIAIAFVVFLVKGSLPLAFSLAGIVAAVRFRTSLSDTTDAVFLFVVIGIGLAAGVQLLFVAFMASAIFAGVALAVWGTRFAEAPPQLVGFRLIQPDSALSHRPPGAKKPGKGKETRVESPETTFLVHSSDPEHAERLAGLVFGRYAKEWKPMGASDGEEGARVLEFLVRLKKRFDSGVVLEAFRELGDPSIQKVEALPAPPGLNPSLV